MAGSSPIHTSAGHFMRWFRPDLLPGDDEWIEADAAYAKHLTVFLTNQQRAVRTLATDPGFVLKDGLVNSMVVNLALKRVDLVVSVGSLSVGYRRLSIHFENATVQPDDLRLLADAIGATFRANR